MEEKDKEVLVGALKKLLEEIEEANEEDDLNQLIKMTERFTFNNDQLSLRVKECVQGIHKGRQSLDQLLRGSISMLMEDHDDHDDEEGRNFERIVWENVEKIRLLLNEEVTLFCDLEDFIDSIFPEPEPPQDHHQAAHDHHHKEVQDHDHDDKAKDDDVGSGDEAAMDDDGSNENIISESAADEGEEEMQGGGMEEIQHRRETLHQMIKALIVKLERLAISCGQARVAAMSDQVIVSDGKDHPETEVKDDKDPENNSKRH